MWSLPSDTLRTHSYALHHEMSFAADLDALRKEMRGYLDRGYNVVKMKIGGADLAEDRERIEAVLKETVTRDSTQLAD